MKKDMGEKVDLFGVIEEQEQKQKEEREEILD
jgi:hypothetical protein